MTEEQLRYLGRIRYCVRFSTSVAVGEFSQFVKILDGAFESVLPGSNHKEPSEYLIRHAERMCGIREYGEEE